MENYHIRLSVYNSKHNELVKIINFTTSSDISLTVLTDIFSPFVKSTYSYSVEKGWKLSKTAKILAFDEAIIAVSKFRFIESVSIVHRTDEKEEFLSYIEGDNYKDPICMNQWDSGCNRFYIIRQGGCNGEFVDFDTINKTFTKLGLSVKKTKTKGTIYTNTNIKIGFKWNGKEHKLAVFKCTPPSYERITNHIEL